MNLQLADRKQGAFVELTLDDNTSLTATYESDKLWSLAAALHNLANDLGAHLSKAAMQK